MASELPVTTPGYDIVSRLGRGGMAEIYLARDQHTGSLVALKRIRPEIDASAEFLDMFADEMRLLSHLHHKGIPCIIDANHTTYFAMEYVHSVSARDVLKQLARQRERLPLHLALHIIETLLDILHYAHHATDTCGRPLRIVHRDVSPSNVLLGFDGEVRLVDFGVAKSRISRGQTHVGLLKGKVSYVSPEHCVGAPLDCRSDVFAAGVVLHELLTTRKLYRGPTEYAVLHRIVNSDAAPPSLLRSSLPFELDQVVAKALARDPGKRYQTAAEFRDALVSVREAIGIGTSPDLLRCYLGIAHRDAAARRRRSRSMRWPRFAVGTTPPQEAHLSAFEQTRTTTQIPTGPEHPSSAEQLSVSMAVSHHLRIGFARARNGQHVEAQKAFASALELDPRCLAAARALARLQDLLGRG